MTTDTIAHIRRTMALMGRMLLRQQQRNADDLIMAVAAVVADSMRAHLEPDSTWRLNLIKEIADYINDDNTITLAAIEGSVVDLGRSFAALKADLDRLRRGD